MKDVKDAVRTNLACLVRIVGQEYSAATVNRCRRGPDCKTTYELRKGRKFARALQRFAEMILFMIHEAIKSVARVEPRWEDGGFLGVSRLEAEIAKSDDGRVRLTTAYLRSLDRDEGRPAESAGAPAAVPVPPIPSEAQDVPLDDGAGARAPMDVIETSRKRSVEDAGHETDDTDRGGVQPDPTSMADDSMQEAMRDAGALGADAVLADAYSPARFQQRAGAFGLSAGVAMDRRLGWGLGLEADQVKAQKRIGVKKPHLLILSPRTRGTGQASLGV